MKPTDREIAAMIRFSNQVSHHSNLVGLLKYPENSESREACALAIAIEALGEPFPDVPACLMNGQHISELMPSIQTALADYLSPYLP